MRVCNHRGVGAHLLIGHKLEPVDRIVNGRLGLRDGRTVRRLLLLDDLLPLAQLRRRRELRRARLLLRLARRLHRRRRVDREGRLEVGELLRLALRAPRLHLLAHGVGDVPPLVDVPLLRVARHRVRRL